MHCALQVFELFDIKKNDVIGFDEFVRALSVFHPSAPVSEKAHCKFSLLVTTLDEQSLHDLAAQIQTVPPATMAAAFHLIYCSLPCNLHRFGIGIRHSAAYPCSV